MDRSEPERLLGAARGGDRESLGRLLQFYRNYLHLLARTQIDLHLQARVSPSDLVQETFLEAHRDFGQFRGQTEREMLAWLRRILVHNLARLVETHVKAKRRSARREVSLEQRLKAIERSSVDIERALVSPWTSTPSAQAQRRELAATLADQLARLPESYRDVIVLRNLEGLSFEEVAERMGRTPGAVRMLWMRALDRLRRLLENEDLL